MPSRDLLHPVVRRALERDGWEITDDPLRLVVGRRSMYVDLGAEQLIAASRGTVRIVLRKDQPDRTLWLAVPSRVWTGLFREALGELLLEDGSLRLLVVDAEQEVIERWIPSIPGATPSNAS